VLVLELVDRFVRRFGSSAVEVADWLHERGYELATYDVPANRLDVTGRSLAGSRTNVFAVLLEKVPFIESRLAHGAADTVDAENGTAAGPVL
jgi:hypothetical protein